MSPNTSNILFPYLFPGGQSKVSPSLSSPFRKEKYSGHTSFMFSLTYFSPMPLSYSHLTKPKSILEAISLTPRFSTHKSKQMTNLLILLCSLSLLLLPSSFQQLAEFDYTGFNQIGPNITLSGSSEIMKSGILQLTNDTTRIMGHAFYTSPIQFKNSPNSSVFSFSTCFAFVIVPEYPLLGGHGLAFALSPSRDLQSAEPSLYLGLMNSSNDGNFSNHLFAVEFDTFQDIKFKDINDNHIGIDMNSLESNESVTAAYYTKDLKKQDLNLKGGKPILVWIDYDSISTQINVTVSPSNSKPELPIISYKYDLSPLLYESMFVGFSASTGQVAGSHYLLGWSFKINGTAESLSLNSLPSLPRPKKKPTVLIIGVSVSSFVFLIGAILSGLYLLWKIKNTEVIEDWELGIGPHRYSYQELNQATRGFKDSELLGAGGFGRVYKGTLPNSMAHVAVKQISHNSRQGFPEFFSEITSIGRLRHRNLVQLLGWCRRGDDLLLVYDFMPNGSLDKFLFDKPATILNWQQRFNIIKGVASALLYLHEGYEQIVIHRDVKASNVLLDNELNGRLGDFGLAKLYEHGATPCTTHVVGTIGYLAPEYAKTGKASTNSDVFAFGTLLLEVVCGRRPIKPKAAPRELVLVDWVWDMWQEGDVFGVVDPNLKGAFDETEVWMVLKLGLMCSNEVPMVRPSLRQVVRYLEGEVPLPNDLRPPWEVKSGWRMGGGGSGSGEGFEGFNGFDGYENMLLSSSTFEKGSGNSFRRSRDVDASYGSISLQSTGDAR